MANPENILTDTELKAGADTCPLDAVVSPRRYSVIYADPPWRYAFSKDSSDQIENHYPTMSLAEICALQIPADENSVLFLWTTAPKLKEAMTVIDAWGFEYKTNAVWDKKWIGMGYWFRGRHEHLLVATKGKFSPPPQTELIPSIFEYKRGKHSKKPQPIRDLIKNWFPDSARLELFARKPNELFADDEYEGWDLYGNEVESTIVLTATG
jgi:N6-adenosine-specific RNA methylase IME4